MLSFFWYVAVKMLYKNKNIVAKQKIEMAPYYVKNKKMFSSPSWVRPPFWIFSSAIMILFLYTIRTTTYQKIRLFHPAVVL
jgi:hypothetical protein